MTEPVVPLGQPESVRLELKAKESLRRPERIGREVVAMLNAEGGSVWIGVGEEGGRAVALEEIDDVRAQADRLHSSLVDRIAPPLRQSELQVVPLPGADGPSGLIRIEVTPDPSRRPYGMSKAGDWSFPIRVGARTRALSHDELREMFRAGSSSTTNQALRQLEVELAASRGRRQDALWLRLLPTHHLRLDLVAVCDRGYLTDPAKTGNRRIGKSFTNAAVLGGEVPRPKQGAVTIGREGIFYVTVFEDGGLLFEAPLTTLYGGGGERQLDSEALMEYPTSLLRLWAALASDIELWPELEPPAETQILALLALFGLRDWKLSPGSPRPLRAGWIPQPEVYDEQDDFVTQPVVRLGIDEVRRRPDECSFRLWSRVYEAFGFWPKDYPPEYDLQTGRLVLPL